MFRKDSPRCPYSPKTLHVLLFVFLSHVQDVARIQKTSQNTVKIIDTMYCFENTKTIKHVVGNDEKGESNVNIHLNQKQTFST